MRQIVHGSQLTQREDVTSSLGFDATMSSAGTLAPSTDFGGVTRS